jgi:glutamate-5-semialdehyde dehydrogenase
MQTLPEVYQAFVAAEQFRATAQQRDQLVRAIAQAVKRGKTDLLEANTLDLESCREMAVPELLVEWLKLTPERLQQTIDNLLHIAALPDPLGHSVGRLRVPLGAIALIYEGFPQLGLIGSCMAFKTGNSLILKGGSEGSQTHRVVATLIHEAISDCGLPTDILVALPQGSSIKDLVTQERYLRLAIPYGRPSFVQQICRQATVSLLPAAMGNCFLYLAPTAHLDRATEIVRASRLGEPEAATAVEKVLCHRSWLSRGLGLWVRRLVAEFDLLLDAALGEIPELSAVGAPLVEPEHLGQAFLDRRLAVKVVDDLDDAISLINQYSSGHADVLVTDSLSESQQFSERVQSSTIFINSASTFVRCTPQNAALGLTSVKMRGSVRSVGEIDLVSLTAVRRIL